MGTTIDGLTGVLTAAGIAAAGPENIKIGVDNLAEVESQELNAEELTTYLSSVSRKMGQDELGSQTGAIAIDFSSGSFDHKHSTLTGNVTPTLTASVTGSLYIWLVTGAGFSITWPANVKWIGAARQPAAAGNSLFALYYDGTNFIPIE